MLLLSIDKVRPGMITAKRIYDNQGYLILDSNITLNCRSIISLINKCVCAIYIKSSYEDGKIRQTRLIDTKKKILQAFQLFIENYHLQNQHRQHSLFNLTVSRTISVLLAEKSILRHLATLSCYDYLTFCHCVNVCGLSIVIGQKLGLDDAKLKELSLGAILHDLGKIDIPTAILNKSTSLTEKEWLLVKTHPFISYNIIKSENILPESVAQITYQHHENYDGSGYPLGLSGREINLLSRIVATADVYDAVTTFRTYRDALLPSEAFTELEISKKTKLDPSIVDIFLA